MVCVWPEQALSGLTTVITLKNSDGNHGKPFSKNVKLILLILCRSDMSRMQNEQHLVCVCVCVCVCVWWCGCWVGSW